MEYTDNEKQILALIERTDFKNLSKNDFISYASKLNELRPEVARQVIAQFPELATLLRSALTEYKGILDEIVTSDDASIDQTYGIINKEMDHAAARREEFIRFADKIRSDCSKCLDHPDMTPEETTALLDRELELLRIVGQKDTEISAHEHESVRMANEKDSEKRMFNWKLLGSASAVVLAAVGIGTAVLGGKFDIKLPSKK